MKCPECGARPTREDARFCDYCGTKMPEPERPPPSSTGPLGDLPARFATADRDSRLPALRRHRPSTAGHMGGLFAIIGFLVVFIAVSLFIGGMAGGMGAGGIFTVVPLLFVAIGVVMIFVMVGKSVKFQRAPLRNHLAAIAGERTSVSGGGQNSSASTTYYVTLQFRNGSRREYTAAGRVAGEVTTGDIGLAFVKGGVLLDFRRINA